MKKRLILFLSIFIGLSIILSTGFITIGNNRTNQYTNLSLTPELDISQLKENMIEMIRTEWPWIYDKSDEDCFCKVRIDSNENIILAGYSYVASSNSSDLITIKYTSDGEEIWNVTYDGGKFDYLWDLEIDSQDNIIVFGINYSSIDSNQNFDFVYHLVKYNRDGVKQWNKSYSWLLENDTFPGGISIDSNDNIVLSGGYGNLNYASFHCWITKMDSLGNELWNTTFMDDLVSMGSDVVIDANDDIYVGGLTASFFGQGWFTVKYDDGGNKQWVQRYNIGNMMYDLEMDSEQNLILSGQYYSEESESGGWLTIKADKDGNHLWEKKFDSPDYEYSNDVATDSKNNIITIGSINTDENFQPCFIIYDETGKEICMKKPADRIVLEGVTVDKNDDIIATGSYSGFNSWDFYTNKYTDNLPPTIEIEKPRPGYLYIANQQIIPLFERAIVFGDILVKIDTENPSDISKVQFYVDNQLQETLDAPPYEWSWNNRCFGKYTLEIQICDENANIKREIINVWKFF